MPDTTTTEVDTVAGEQKMNINKTEIEIFFFINVCWIFFIDVCSSGVCLSLSR